MRENLGFVGVAANPMASLCTMAKIAALPIPWYDYGQPQEPSSTEP